ncbi:CHAT domain-containing protein [Actinoplanes bogorensis]|uniref:CHAT domain-containing protein n=1 Tax=Paractinoplanes bogorensis TaxID=1610840 RepID=A0ABS5YZQ2_9ACTN|nr:CHAT domain-containing protein [Actinoplanes bogorensis]MBU2668179.1 CHAT domain-containing protein [Actinoplanes bogorensis]
MTDDGLDQDPIRMLAREQMAVGWGQMAAYGRTTDPDHLDAAIRAWDTVVELGRASPFPELGAVERAAENCYLMRWRLRHDTADLDRVLAGRQHLDNLPVDSPDDAVLHQALVAEALQARFDEHGRIADLDESTDRLRQALGSSGDDSQWRPVIEAQLLRNEVTRRILTDEQFTASISAIAGETDDELVLQIRAMGYFMRYRAGGPRSDAREAIALYDRAMRVAPDPESAAKIELSVGGVQAALFERTGAAADLDEAIARYTRAVGTLRDTKKFREGLVHLLNACTTRIQAGIEPPDHAAALDVMRRHVDDDRLDATARVQIRISISFQLQHRARHDRSREDVTAAVTEARRAVAEAAGTGQAAVALSQLATALALNLELFGDDSDVRETARVAEKAAKGSAEDDAARVLRHLNAARLWTAVGRRDQDRTALDRALTLLAAVVHLDHELQPAILLQVQLTRRERLRVTEDPADLDAAVEAGLALWNSPASQAGAHSIQSALELGEMLRLRGSLNRSTADLEAAYQVGMTVASMSADEQSDTSEVLYRMVALPSRALFDLTDDSHHLDRAIEAAARATETPTDPHDAVEFCIGLAQMLRDRFDRRESGTGDDDLRTAIRHYETVLARPDLGDDDRPRLLIELAGTLHLAFRAGHSPADGRTALTHARAAATSSAAGDRLRSHAWALCAELAVAFVVASDPSVTVDDAVRFGQSAVDTDGASAGAYPRWSLYRALALRYDRNNDESDFTRALAALAPVGADAGNADRADALADAARLHHLRYRRRHERHDLDRAIDLLREAVTAAGPESENLIQWAADLYDLRRTTPAGTEEADDSEAGRHAIAAQELSEQFGAGRDPALGESAVAAWFAAALLDPDRYGPGLAAAARSAVNDTADLRTLHGLYFRLAWTQDRPTWPQEAVVLVELLRRRWRAGLEPSAAEALATAARLLRGRSTDPRLVLHCADSLFELFSLSGESSQLSAAIESYQAVRPDPVEPAMAEHVRRQLETAHKHIDDPLNRARAAADRAHADFLGDQSAESSAALLVATRAAVALAPAGHSEHANLMANVANVANAALLVAQFTRDAASAGEAVTAARAAAGAADTDRFRAKGRYALAAALMLAVRTSFDADALKEALTLAAGLLDDESYAAAAQGLMAELMMDGQSDEDGDRDLHRIVQYAREAVAGLDEMSVARDGTVLTLVRALFRRFASTRDLDDLAEALRQIEVGNRGIAAGARRLADGLDDPSRRPPPEIILEGLEPGAADKLAELAVGLVPLVDDDLAEWLIGLRLHLIDPGVASHARQRYLVSAARGLKDEHPSLALRFLRRATAELAGMNDRDARTGAAQAWSMIGGITESAEDWPAAFDAYERARNLYRHMGERASEIYQLRDMAVVCTKRGDEESALAYFDEALRANEALHKSAGSGPDTLQPELLMLSAPSAAPEESARRMDRAIALWTAAGNRGQAHHGHVSRAMLAVAQHDAATAVRNAHAAADLAASASMAEDSYVVVWRSMMGGGMTEEARALEEPTAALFRRSGELPRAAHALYSFALARQAAGDRDGALSSMAAAKQEFQALDDLDGVAAVDGRIAGLHLESRDFDQAVASFRSAAEQFAAAGKWDKAALGYRNAAILRLDLEVTEPAALSSQNREAALADLDKADEFAERSGDPSVRLYILLGRAKLDGEAGDHARAAERLAEATRLAGGDALATAMIEEVKAELAEARGDLTGEQEALESARDYFERAGKPSSAGTVARRLALVYEKSGDIRRARASMQFALDNVDTDDAADIARTVQSVTFSSPRLLDAMRARIALWDLRLGDARRSREELDGLSTEHLTPERQSYFAADRAIRAAHDSGDLATALTLGQEALSVTSDPELRSLLLHDLSPTARNLGRLELAYDYAKEGAEVTEDPSLKIAHLRNLGSAARVRGRVAEAVDALEQAAALIPTTDRSEPSNELDVLNSLALALIDSGDWSKAQTVIDDGLRLARSSGQRRHEASLLQSRGNLSMKQHDVETAYDDYRESIRIQEDLGGDDQLAGAYANLGHVEFLRGHREEARELTERALLAERRTGQLNGVVLTLLTLAQMDAYGEVGEGHLAEALEISRRNDYRSGVGNALLGLGAAALVREDTATALVRFTEAIEVFREIGETPQLVMSLLQRSITASETDDLSPALLDAEEADRLQRTVSAGQESAHGPGAAVLDQLITCYLRTGQAAKAWRRVEQSKARDLLAQLDAEELPAPEDNSSPNDLDAIVSRGHIGLLAFYHGQSIAATLIHGRGMAEPIAVRRMRLPDDVFDGIRRAHGEPAPAILYLPAEDGGKKIVRTDMRHLPYVALIGDLEPAIADGSELLYLLPHRQLNQIPLHALGPDGGTLLDRAPVAYAPSAAVLRRLLDRPRAGADQPSLVLGYASPDGRDAAVEIEGTTVDVAAQLGVDPQWGTRATRSRIAGTWRVLHLSGHGVFHQHDPLGSGIHLADGLLTAREIMRMRIDADLVVLAACESGLSGPDDTVDAAGLGHALLYAGARCALLTLWPVGAETTRTLLGFFYTNLLAGQSKAAALRHAVLDLRRLPGKDQPSVWGAYILLGDAG